ncbi:hypothetical protein RF656_21110, partial [Yersinia kristensenii]|nr:hypothetical protein [Yersinia kristensenii]
GIKGAVAGDTIAKVHQLVGENARLTDKAASELSNSWLLHRAVMTIQAALHCIHGTNIYEAQCWLESIADDAELVIPPEMMLSDLQRWFDENMTGLITHAKAVEIIKAEISATTQALNEIKAQGVDDFGDFPLISREQSLIAKLEAAQNLVSDDGKLQYIRRLEARAEKAEAALSAANEKPKLISFDELADRVKYVTGGIRMSFDPLNCKGHQIVPFMNFNSLSRIVEMYRTTETYHLAGFTVEGE